MCFCTADSPFSRRWRSSLLWRTTCGPWCRWLRSSSCRSVLSDQPAAGFSADPSGRSWSERGIAPAVEKERLSWVLNMNRNLQEPAYLARYNLLIDLDGLICKERRVASCHFIDEDSQCPPVHSFVIALRRFRQTTHVQKVLPLLHAQLHHPALPVIKMSV